MRMCVSDIDLAPCYQFRQAANNLIVNCHFCSAGWLPSWSSPARPLILHARTHRRRLLPLLPREGLHSGMAIKVPSDVRPVRDSRLDLIRVISTLHDRIVDSDDSLKAKVKATMQNKGAAYAEGELAVAALRAGGVKGSIDPRRLYKMVGDGKLSMSQFLSCVSIKRKPLEEFLAGSEIDRITTTAGEASPSLTVEFKPDRVPDLDRLIEVLLASIEGDHCVATGHTDAA